MPQARRAIASVARFRPDNHVAVLLVAAMAALGVAHVLVRTSTYGPAITLDSAHYLSVARSLAAGAGLTLYDGTPLQPLAPFLPMLLAFIDTLGIEPRESVRWVNAAAFGLAILVSGLWLLRNLSSRTLALAATLAILVSLPFNDLAAQAMTEPLFVLLSLLAMIQVGLFLTGEARWKPVLLAAVFTALAAITRYPGVVLILTGAPLLLLHRAVPFSTRLRYAIVFGGIASLPVAAAIARRSLLVGTLGPLEGASGQSLSDSLRQVGRVAREWIVPEVAPDWSGNLWFAAGALLAAGMVAMLIARMLHRGTAQQSLRAALPFGLFVPVYLAFIIIATPRLVGQTIDSRYLLPLYVPLILTGVFLLDRLFTGRSLREIVVPRWIPASAVLLIVLASAGFSVHRNLIITAEARDFGYKEATYNTSYWNEFETLDQLGNIPDSTLVFSHDSAAIWWRYPDSWDGYFWISDDIDSIIRIIEDHPQASYLVSLNAQHSHHNPFVALLNDVDVVLSAKDGFILRVPGNWNFDSPRFLENMAAYFSSITGEFSGPLSRSVFDIYVTDSIIIYTKDPCKTEDTGEWFFLHIDPVDINTLPQHRRKSGFDNLDFLGERNDFRFGTTCIVSVPLPPYPISAISTGQYDPLTEEQAWSVEFSFPDGSEFGSIYGSPVQWRVDEEQYQADMMRYRSGRTDEYGEWVGSSTFDVYSNGRTLVYVKDPCLPEDTEAWFFLHVDPEDPADLPRERQQHGFYSFDFLFDWQGAWSGERCLTTVELPDYGITDIRTGQYDFPTGRHLWRVEFSFRDSPDAGSVP